MSPDSGTAELTPSLRTVTPADALPAGRICYTAFKTIAEQHNFAPDFPDPETAIGLMHHLAARSDIHGVAAEAAGRIVGSNFLWEDGEVAGVGPITIDPVVQNAGLGRRLMEAVIGRAHARGIQRVRLVQAAYHNRTMSLYTKLGFDVREPLSVLQGPALAVATEGCDVRPAGADDIAAADALCRRIHGHARSGELRAAIEQDAANVVERDGRITGYTTGIGFFGHAVGETNEDLQALIATASSFAGPGFLLPTRNATLLRWCLDHSLRIVQPMTLMTMGPYQQPRGAFLPSILY
ncbi:MAG TPA: GNAT family N-acetyltransferase [Dongiaceae bacterium]|nr:GNAT family N-acetyltransferase [Dongiaceae bacterium]